jgi:hypothetical protein
VVTGEPGLSPRTQTRTMPDTPRCARPMGSAEFAWRERLALDSTPMSTISPAESFNDVAHDTPRRLRLVSYLSTDEVVS